MNHTSQDNTTRSNGRRKGCGWWALAIFTPLIVVVLALNFYIIYKVDQVTALALRVYQVGAAGGDLKNFMTPDVIKDFYRLARERRPIQSVRVSTGAGDGFGTRMFTVLIVKRKGQTYQEVLEYDGEKFDWIYPV